MKIAMINPTKSYKTMIYDLAQNLAKRGHEISILQPESTSRIFDFNTHTKDIDDVIRVLPLPCVFLPRIRYTLPHLQKEYTILSSLIDEGVELIHVGEYFYPTVFPPLCVKKKKSCPVVICSDAMVGVSWRYNSFLVDCIAHTYTKTLGKHILTQSDAAVFLYHTLAAQAELLGIPPQKVTVIPNGVDTTAFNSIDPTASRNLLNITDENVILTVCRLAPVKGIETLIAVTRMLLKEGIPVKTLVAGDGPYRKAYERKARDLKDNFVFLGNVPHNRIPSLISACDVFLLTSISEGLPSVVLEAGACRKPVVASNVGGIPDIISDGASGFLVNPKDVSSFFTATKQLLQNPQLAHRFASTLHNHILKTFSWDTIVKKYEKIYESLI
jgi:glycosyltransferase involved in cell wall biosynthesis